VGIRASTGTQAQGGPFIPAELGRTIAPPRDPAFQRLAAAIDRMERLEQLVASLPSALPAQQMNLSSGFGFRHDPFNGRGAMHAGLDFRGAYSSPIRAAAAGRVSFVGGQSGYGNVVEIDHGHGIMTRYAHLAGFTATPGQAVVPGQQIGRMGSSGRSTGTHLHFEVRVNGTAVNPRRFLEVNSDVLQIKADVGERFRTRAGGR
ncbi:MAG: M23 family metallopeptidase, partial [Sphingopyxis sp.]